MAHIIPYSINRLFHTWKKKLIFLVEDTQKYIILNRIEFIVAQKNQVYHRYVIMSVAILNRKLELRTRHIFGNIIYFCKDTCLFLEKYMVILHVIMNFSNVWWLSKIFVIERFEYHSSIEASIKNTESFLFVSAASNANVNINSNKSRMQFRQRPCKRVISQST